MNAILGSPRDARHPVCMPSPTIPRAWFGIGISLARLRFHRRVICRCIAALDAQFCKSSAAIFIPTPCCIRFCHSPKAAIMSSLNPLHARRLCGKSAHSTYRNVIPSECNPNLADPRALGYHPIPFGTPYWTAIGQSTQISFQSNLPNQ
jgi:hypothetical protein